MLSRKFAILAALLVQPPVALAETKVASIEPLAPIGPWVVEQRQIACAATRTYGPGENVVLRLTTRPIEGGYYLGLHLTKGVWLRYNDPVQVAIEPNRNELTTRVTGFAFNNYRPADFDMAIGETLLRGDPSEVKISGKPGVLADLAMDQVPATLAALGKCDAELRAKFGVDPVVQASVATPPEPLTNEWNWVNQQDFPRMYFSGVKTVAGRYRVEANGSILGCWTVISSGEPQLDKLTCSLFLERGKFVPARSKDGKAVPSDRLFAVRLIGR